MKKLNLQLGNIKEMLTREQMKKVSGGYDPGDCLASTELCNPITEETNCCEGLSCQYDSDPQNPLHYQCI